ncbi:MAG: MarC family protein [Gammaproteobacteria bacterium]|jgi:multiple antibiotic resistance protein
MLSEAALLSFAATLFSMMNPIGNIGVFAGLTSDISAAKSRRVAWTCAFSVVVTLTIVAWAGPGLLAFFGVTVDSLRAAGGLIVLLIGLHMLFNKSEHKHSSKELEDAQDRSSIAVVPLTIPIVAGPGTMTAVLVAAQQQPTVLTKIEISLVIVGFSVLVGLLFSFASPIANRIGESGMGVVTRIMGMILAAIAMGMLAEGLTALLPGLAGPAN